MRFGLIFFGSLLAGFGLLVAPFAQPAINRATSGLVDVSALLLRLSGAQAVGQNDLLRNPTSGFSIQVKNTCNASNVTILLWAAILGFPASWAAKGKGIIAGTLAIQVANLFRIVSLFYIGQIDTRWFEFMHLYVWESVFVLFTLTIFWTWVRRTHAKQPHPSHS